MKIVLVKQVCKIALTPKFETFFHALLVGYVCLVRVAKVVGVVWLENLTMCLGWKALCKYIHASLHRFNLY